MSQKAKIIGTIEEAIDGVVGIYANDDVPVEGFCLTVEEAKEDFERNLHEQVKYCREKTGSDPYWYSQDMEIEYRYED